MSSECHISDHTSCSSTVIRPHTQVRTGSSYKTHFFLPFPAFQWLKTGGVAAIRASPFLWWSDIYSGCVAALPANLASRLCCLKHHHRDQAASSFSGFRFWSIWSIIISFRCRLQVSALLSLVHSARSCSSSGSSVMKDGTRTKS